MHCILVLLSFFLGLLALVRAEAHEEAPELNVITTFPNNPFNIVKNGQSTRVVFTFTQPRGVERAIAVNSLTGAFLDPARKDGERKRIMRNMTNRILHDDPLVQFTNGKPLQLPYDIHSEFKPQKLDIELRATVTDKSSLNKYNVLLYRGSVTVEEPPQSLWDLELLSVYLFLAGLVGAVAYYVYVSYIQPTLRANISTSSSKRKDKTPAPVANKDGKTYDESWIPEEAISQQQRPRARKNRSRK
ncbi:uncharacterized protein MRET_2887 [Malassezia restricta]|uniref:uncharacterized protein n=1 Tax=Malassezia restricta TaxID=76775 RepID=UPI000DD1453E|nr:uncharacterized protein MRET_2887 [Malassezia restricta]AXA51149.1 uncharacterized protein MRET_2887 [Malassezia restricta]